MLKLFLPHKDWLPQSLQQKYFREHVKTLPGLLSFEHPSVLTKIGYHNFNKSGLESTLKLFLPHKDWVPQSFQQKF